MTQVRVAELGNKADLDADMASITLGCDVRGRPSFHGTSHLILAQVGVLSMKLYRGGRPDLMSVPQPMVLQASRTCDR
jgi:hypothetical protein